MLIDTKKLKSLGWSSIGVLVFYAVSSLAAWGLYEWLLENDLGLDLSYPNFLGAFGIILIITLITKLTYNDGKRTNIPSSVPPNGERMG